MYIAKPTVAVSELNGGAVLLDLDKSRYFGLNPVGEVVWRQLASPQTLDQLRDAVCHQFDVSSEVCEADIGQLILQFLERGLIERYDPPAI